MNTKRKEKGAGGTEGNEGGKEERRAGTYFALRIAQAVGEGFFGEAGEDNRVDRADTNERNQGGKERQMQQSVTWTTRRKD